MSDGPPRLERIFDCYDPPLFFITICTKRRRKILSNETVHNAFREFAGRGFARKGIAIGRYVIMPDHMHLFVTGPPEFRLEQWARMLKLVLGRAVGRALAAASAPTARGDRVPDIWQRGAFDHVIRNHESYGQKWDYVRMNPVRDGLVAEPEMWPYQGEMVLIMHQ